MRSAFRFIISLTGPRATARTLGLPPGVRACLFDLDGVLTASAEIHAAAWRDSLNDFLSRRLERTGERFGPFRPFSTRRDYYRYVHGKPRLVGAHAFLASRGIKLPEGRPDDSGDAETVFGLANRKSAGLSAPPRERGDPCVRGSAQYLEAAREAGMKCAVISASANTERMLERSGLAPMIDRIVDGNVIRSDDLESKPAPDTIITACKLLGVEASEAATFETTLVGVEASRTAGVAFTSWSIEPGGKRRSVITAPRASCPTSSSCSIRAGKPRSSRTISSSPRGDQQTPRGSVSLLGGDFCHALTTDRE